MRKECWIKLFTYWLKSAPIGSINGAIAEHLIDKLIKCGIIEAEDDSYEKKM